jgi:hypothetical protein
MHTESSQAAVHHSGKQSLLFMLTEKEVTFIVSQASDFSSTPKLPSVHRGQALPIFATISGDAVSGMHAQSAVMSVQKFFDEAVRGLARWLGVMSLSGGDAECFEVI